MATPKKKSSKERAPTALGDQFVVRVDPETRVRAEKLIPLVSERILHPAKMSDVIRFVIHEGLRSLEQQRDKG